MAAADHSEEARAWLRAEIDAQCFGEEFGFDVWPQVLSGDGGMQVNYVIMITMRSPLLGKPPLMYVAGSAVARLTADLVKHVVTSGLQQLRELSAQALATANGRPA